VRPMSVRYSGRARRHPAVMPTITALLLMLVGVWPPAISQAYAEGQRISAYQISAGDKLTVTVFDQRDLSGDYVVDQTGNIRLPIIGDITAAGMTASGLEASIARALAQGYVRDPVVSLRVAEFNPIHVVGLVRTPGVYPYRQGISVLGAIAQAGGIGTTENRQAIAIGEALQSDERVRLLELTRASLVAKRARLFALSQDEDEVKFPDISADAADPSRVARILENERREFDSERTARQQQIGLLEGQAPRLQSQLNWLREQKALELKQRNLNQELIADYENLMKTGLTRKPPYIEAKREESRINSQIARLESEMLRTELAISDLQFKIGDVRSVIQRRVSAELQDTERALLELTVTLPSARRAKAFRTQQIGMLSVDEAQQPTIFVIRQKGGGSVKTEATLDFALLPGDVVQVGSLFPPSDKLPVAQYGPSSVTESLGVPPQPGTATKSLQQADIMAPGSRN
jgi:polysaccharide export outer membrane protein